MEEGRREEEGGEFGKEGEEGVQGGEMEGEGGSSSSS